MSTVVPKPSKVEGIKLASEYLKGSLLDESTNGLDHFTDDAGILLKFHGSYQQDDRDLRTQRKKQGLDKAHSVMVRVRMPGGRFTAAQYRLLDNLAGDLGNGSLRVTTRQEIQYHGVPKTSMKMLVSTLNRSLLTTLAACGDVERNVLGCPAPIMDNRHAQMREDLMAFAAHFAPRSSSYWDIWLDGEKLEGFLPEDLSLRHVPTAGDDPVEPIYGKSYLPRKFKTGFAFPDDNCTDMMANDLGFLAILSDGEILGWDIYVGGGMGTTPSSKRTFPALGVALCYATRADFLKISEAIIKVYRDFGDRSDRKRARLKYIIADWGVDAFRAKVEEYLGHSISAPTATAITSVDDHLGWHKQGNGKWFLGVPIENGRIKNDLGLQLKTGLRAIVDQFDLGGAFTCQQSVLFSEIQESDKAAIEKILEDHHIARADQISSVRRWSMACPAMPTCGLAVTEAERALPGLLDKIEAVVAKLGLENEAFTIRMTGCPNGCARPYNSDIGLVGRSAGRSDDGSSVPGTYTIFLGGRLIGDRLNRIYKDYVPFDQIPSELETVLTRFRNERENGESFGEFCFRIQIAAGEVAGGVELPPE
ncbi:MAG: NADPH-dependent assimilatory sulfite reductase hemoprotein subunit [Planctomycetota bacterium]|nr:NADPH-dependent assimilatory sulfite reductase hemoprotein subunit [Planctomycetota bacterium]